MKKNLFFPWVEGELGFVLRKKRLGSVEKKKKKKKEMVCQILIR